MLANVGNDVILRALSHVKKKAEEGRQCKQKSGQGITEREREGDSGRIRETENKRNRIMNRIMNGCLSQLMGLAAHKQQQTLR